MQAFGLGLVSGEGFSGPRPVPLYSLSRTFCNMEVVGFFLTAPPAGGAASLPSPSLHGFLCTLRSSTDSQGAWARFFPFDRCFTLLDRSKGCWLHTFPKGGLGAHSLEALYSSGLSASLSSLPDRLHAGELLRLSSLGGFALRAASVQVGLPSPAFPGSRRPGLCCGELVRRLNLLELAGRRGEEAAGSPSFGISPTGNGGEGATLLLSCV